MMNFCCMMVLSASQEPGKEKIVIMTPALREAIIATFICEAFDCRWPSDKITRTLANLEAVADFAPIPDHDEEDDDAVGTQLDYFGLWHLAG